MRKNVKRCDMDINVALRDCGHVDLKELFENLQKPPWGWGKDALAAYCFAAAMQNHIDEHWIFDGCMSWTSGESASIHVKQLVTGIGNKRWDHYLFNESGWHLCDRLALMFNTEVRYPLTTMLLNTRYAIEQHTRFPVAILDKRLHELFTKFNDTELFDSSYVKGLTKYYDWERCKRIREKYDTINEDVKAILEKEFPGITDEQLDRATAPTWGWGVDIWWLTESVYKVYNNIHIYDFGETKKIGDALAKKLFGCNY